MDGIRLRAPHFGKTHGVDATIRLQVGVVGGLSSIEDVHVCMGDGEAAVSVVEIVADVTLRRRLSHDFSVGRPVVLTKAEAAMLASVAANLRISEMAGSPCHVRAVPREILCV